MGPEPVIPSGDHLGLSRYETPLVIFDGRRGIVPLGRIPLYALTEFIADRLTEGRHCARRTCVHAAEEALRPTVGGGFALARHGEAAVFCAAQGVDRRCEGARKTILAHLIRVYSLIGIGH